LRPVFANSAEIQAPERFVIKGGRWEKVTLRVRYGLLIHPRHGPILIDTGYTSHAISDSGRGLALRLYGALLSPKLIPEQQPEELLDHFGFAPADVAYVIVTHFHADHVSGLSLFPNARFIADDVAWSRIRSLNGLGRLHNGVFDELFPPDFEDRLEGISGKPPVNLAKPDISGVDLIGDGSLVGIDLPGHADGHFGVLFTHMDPPLLYAVDTQWTRQALIEDRSPGFPASLVAANRASARGSSRVVRSLIENDIEVVLCHEPEPAQVDFRQEEKN
jgi:glyoxylase-like metal-dependent hydrolase (beta-lactamase superfamily II)